MSRQTLDAKKLISLESPTSMTNSTEEVKNLLDTIFDTLPDPVFVKDEHHRCIFGNAAFSRMLNLPRERYIGLTDYDLFPKDIADWIWEKDNQIFKDFKSIEIEERVIDAQKGERIVLTQKTPLKLADGSILLIGIIRDITERKQVEQKMKAAELSMSASAKMAALGEMASGIAHEVNNPLTIISGKMDQIRRRSATNNLDTNFVQEAADKIENQVKRISSIINGLRAFARAGSSDPMEDESIEKIIDETQILCRDRFLNHHVKLEVNVTTPGIKIPCRLTQIIQVLINLLNNAFDSVQEQNEKNINLSTRQNGKYLEIRVQDNGPGVSPEIESKIMNPFFTTKPVGKGTGLGLSISYGIIQEHKGTLSLDRKVSSSCFLIRLPIVQ